MSFENYLSAFAEYIKKEITITDDDEDKLMTLIQNPDEAKLLIKTYIKPFLLISHDDNTDLIKHLIGNRHELTKEQMIRCHRYMLALCKFIV